MAYCGISGDIRFEYLQRGRLELGLAPVTFPSGPEIQSFHLLNLHCQEFISRPMSIRYEEVLERLPVVVARVVSTR
jgi:hypothetical protein